MAVQNILVKRTAQSAKKRVTLSQTPGRGSTQANPGGPVNQRTPGTKVPPTSKLLGTTQSVIAKGTAVASAISATWLILGVTWILYLIQLIFAVLSILGIGSLIAYDGSWTEFVDVLDIVSSGGEIFAYLGLGMTLVMGLLTFLIAACVFLFRRVDISRGISTLVAAVCFAFYLAPGLNLVPWAWVWCLYVIKSQVRE